MPKIDFSFLFRKIFFLQLSMLILSSCTKTDIVVIDDNTAPPDSTIENVVKETYVNKIYISLLGRKPTDTEQIESIAILDQDNLSQENRDELVNLLFEKEEYLNRTYEIAMNELLPSVDTAYLSFLIDQYEMALENITDPVYIEILTEEIERLEDVRDILKDLKSDSLSITGMYKRLVNNEPYDELNMGTENFIVSVFQYFLIRYPTDGELLNATTMVDGSSSVVFYQDGSSKNNFIDIFFSYDEYYEGQVRLLYQRYLYREPSSEEMASLAVQYQNSGDYQGLQKSILTSDEYVGISY